MLRTQLRETEKSLPLDTQAFVTNQRPTAEISTQARLQQDEKTTESDELLEETAQC